MTNNDFSHNDSHGVYIYTFFDSVAGSLTQSVTVTNNDLAGNFDDGLNLQVFGSTAGNVDQTILIDSNTISLNESRNVYIELDISTVGDVTREITITNNDIDGSMSSSGVEIGGDFARRVMSTTPSPSPITISVITRATVSTSTRKIPISIT